MLACTIVVLNGACKSCETTLTVFVMWPLPYTRGSKTRSVSAKILIVKITGSGVREACQKCLQSFDDQIQLSTKTENMRNKQT